MVRNSIADEVVDFYYKEFQSKEENTFGFIKGIRFIGYDKDYLEEQVNHLRQAFFNDSSKTIYNIYKEFGPVNSDIPLSGRYILEVNFIQESE